MKITTENLVYQSSTLEKSDRAVLKRQSPCVIWFTGLSGAGKSTIADKRNIQIELGG